MTLFTSVRTQRGWIVTEAIVPSSVVGEVKDFAGVIYHERGPVVLERGVNIVPAGGARGKRQNPDVEHAHIPKVGCKLGFIRIRERQWNLER